MACVDDLASAKAALHALITGEQIVSVTVNGGRENRYTPADASKLRRYIAELEAECGEALADGSTRGKRGVVTFRG